MITRTKSTRDGTSDLDDVKSELFVSDDSEIEPVVIKSNWFQTKSQKRSTAACIVDCEYNIFSKTKIFVGDVVRIMKKEETFGKGYKKSFTDEIFEISSIRILNPPTYFLIDIDKEIIQGKFYQPKLQLVREPPLENGK